LLAQCRWSLSELWGGFIACEDCAVDMGDRATAMKRFFCLSVLSSVGGSRKLC